MADPVSQLPVSDSILADKMNVFIWWSLLTAWSFWFLLILALWGLLFAGVCTLVFWGGLELYEFLLHKRVRVRIVSKMKSRTRRMFDKYITKYRSFTVACNGFENAMI